MTKKANGMSWTGNDAKGRTHTVAFKTADATKTPPPAGFCGTVELTGCFLHARGTPGEMCGYPNKLDGYAVIPLEVYSKMRQDVAERLFRDEMRALGEYVGPLVRASEARRKVTAETSCASTKGAKA